MIYLVTQQLTLLEDSPGIKRATVEESLEKLSKLPEIYIDTETTGLDAVGDRIFLLQLGDLKDQYVIDVSNVDIKKYKELLESSILVAHNAKFDVGFLMMAGIIPDPDKIRCTYMQERVITHGLDMSCSLANTYERYSGKVLDKGAREGITSAAVTERVVRYAAKDVEVLDFYKEQLKTLKERELETVARMENIFTMVLSYVELCGMKLDHEAWYNKCIEDKEILKKAKDALNDFIVDFREDWKPDPIKFRRYIDFNYDLFNPDAKFKCTINWNSPKQVHEILKELRIYPVNDEGKPTTEAKYLEAYRMRSPFVDFYMNYKETAKEVSTYGLKWLENIHPKTGRLHTVFNQLMSTGRISSGDSGSPTPLKRYNFQNIPKEERTRSCFVAAEGHKLIGADYSGQETIVLANFTKDPGLLKFYEDGESDMHSFTCREIARRSNVFPKEICELSLKEIKAKYHHERDITKKAVFAINYGGNGVTIAQNVGCSPSTGESIFNAYFAAYPEIKAFGESVMQEAINKGYILLNAAIGRRYWWPDWDKFLSLTRTLEASREYPDEVTRSARKSWYVLRGELLRLCMNYPIQGSSADMTKVATIIFFKYLIKNNLLWTVKIVNLVHDEIVVECPDEMTDQIAKALEDSMLKAGSMFCKIVPIKVGVQIDRVWKK